MSRPLAVAAVVRHPDGRFLMVRRASTRPSPGVWTPVTGRVEEGEDLRQAAAREVAEETGLAVAIGRELHRCPTSNGAYTLVWFDAWLTSGSDTLRPDRSEIADARWLTRRDILALRDLLAATRAFFEWQLDDSAC